MTPVSYIFASEEILTTGNIPAQSIAYEQVSLAPRDASTFRGIYFTLEEQKTVYTVPTTGSIAAGSRTDCCQLRLDCCGLRPDCG